MHLSQNWIDYKFVVRQPSVQSLQDSNTEARSWLFRGSWNTSTGGEGERGNMLRSQLYRRHVPLYASLLHRRSKAAHNRAIYVFMDIRFFYLFSTSSSYFHFVPFHSASLFFSLSLPSRFFSPSEIVHSYNSNWKTATA